MNNNKECNYLYKLHPKEIEQLYKKYQNNPSDVEESWARFFEGFDFAISSHTKPQATTPGSSDEIAQKELYVLNLINGYRTRGHLFTKTNPVRSRREYSPTLDIENFHLSQSDMSSVFQAGQEIGIGPATLQEIISHLDETYCKSIGAEYMFIRQPERVEWLQQKMESTRNQANFTIGKKKRILHKLNQAVVFENFLHTKFTGQKRFSLQGGETLIPGLEAIIERGSELGIEEYMIGMPHRGRLNVLANTLNKTHSEIFSEFEGKEFNDSVFAGDVKYHLGYSSYYETSDGKNVQIGLAPNPSHLEAVNPVIEGMVRAKIDHKYNGDTSRIIPILVHGDAAIAAQGVVYEVIQMSLLEGYQTGGTIHLVINNQLGFTTDYLDGRSSTYCTDVAKVTRSPVFHVNADDAEAVVQAVELAVEYRQKYNTDVFIDLLGYRKYGHNEGDEPRFTQPQLYKTIAKHPDPRKIYNEKLLSGQSVERGLAEEMANEYRQLLQETLADVRENEEPASNNAYIDQCDLKQRDTEPSFYPIPDTSVTKEYLIDISKRIFTMPDGFEPIRKMKKIYEDRLKKILAGKDIDWAIAELLAYGSLLKEGITVRLSGQDSVRGTFSHRHSVILSEDDEHEYEPLNDIAEGQAPAYFYNSPLSEYGVMGFEYGYACANPEGLTIWEAQFGDFNNAAQIIIDQFLSSSDDKWNRTNGLVLLLPHGYEGQGPEHSSARIERFLSLCANQNMRLANCTTPANFFHLLRTQVKYPFRAPLVVFTPKSLLRHPKCVSSPQDLTEKQFQEVIDDDYVAKSKVRRVLLCSGKVYYDLLEHQQNNKIKDVAILRMELLYPFPNKEIEKVLKGYKNKKEIYWVQEEPENYGPLVYLNYYLKSLGLKFIARKASATPATGFYKQHIKEQKAIVVNAFK